MNIVHQNHPCSRMTIILALVAITVASSVYAVKPKVADSVVSTQPYVTISGPDSKIRNTESQRILSLPDWTKLWLRHQGQPVDNHYELYINSAGLPVVDFSSCMVVAVFEGESWNSFGYNAVSVTESPEQITLRIEGKSYGSGPDVEQKVTPYGFFVLPRSSKPLVVEIEIGDKPARAKPRWRQIAEFKDD